ncbi:hypothetical protein IC582_004170 [Cucumis melo]
MLMRQLLKFEVEWFVKDETNDNTYADWWRRATQKHDGSRIHVKLVIQNIFFLLKNYKYILIT